VPANKEWTAEKSASGGTELITLYENTKPLTFRSLFGMLQDDADYANWYTGLLNRSPFNACFWEHPPLTQSSIDDEAEFVMIDAPMLERMPVNANAFRSYFTGDEIVTFQNLGGDATLIAPSPGESSASYPHLATFLRNSTEEKAAELWRSVGQAIYNSLSNKAVWLSTSGLGVAWLHIRLDATPKYYQHRAYRRLANR
jgi:hypothetical protein